MFFVVTSEYIISLYKCRPTRRLITILCMYKYMYIDLYAWPMELSKLECSQSLHVCRPISYGETKE